MSKKSIKNISQAQAPTARQRSILEFLWTFQNRIGRTPTGPEIAQHFGFSDASSSYEHLRLLAQKGYLKITRSGRKTPLGIRLTDLTLNLLETSYPLFGTVPAGPLEDVVTQSNQRVRSVEDLIPALKPGDYFLSVDGDSMIEAGLQSGDLVVIRSNVAAQDGDICAVWGEGHGNTLKRVRFEENTVLLEPANPAYSPQRLAIDSVRIQGVLVVSLSVKYHVR